MAGLSAAQRLRPTMRLCSFLVDYMHRKLLNQISLSDVEAIIPELLNNIKEYFMGWWINLNNHEKDIITIILTKNTDNLPVDEEYFRAVDFLNKQGIIKKSLDGIWDIEIRLLKRWLKKRIGI